jgi:hypothetical protein
MKKHTIPAWLIVLGAAVLVLGSLLWIGNITSDCNEKGGTLVRSVWAYECMQGGIIE